LRNRSFAVEEFGDLHAEVTLTDDLLNRVSKAFLDSPIAHIQNGVLEKTKHLSLYRDDCLTTADQFNEADVTSMFETARRAIAAVGDARIMRTGRAIFEVWPKAATGRP
jgi:hypothetical protein